MLLLCAPRASAKWEGEGSADGRRSRRGVLPSVVPARFALSPRLHTHRHRRSCRRACRMPPSPSAEAARDPRGPAAGQRGSATHAAGCHPPPQRHGVVEPGGSSRLSQAQVRLKPAQKHRGSNLSGSSPAQVRLVGHPESGQLKLSRPPSDLVKKTWVSICFCYVSLIARSMHFNQQ